MTDTNTTPRGPFETAAQAAAAAEPMCELVRQADPGRGAMTDDVRAARHAAKVRYIADTLTACAVQLGAHDGHLVRWIARTWDPETTVVLLDWVLRARAAATTKPATLKRARYSWVLYKPRAAGGILEAAGSEGTAVGLVDPVKLAADMLAEHTAGWTSVVNVYGADDRLVAWAQWEGGETVAYRHADTAEPAACGRCGTAFDPADTAFDGRARYAATLFCRGCVDQCHEADADHRCVICTPGGAR